MSFFTHYLWQFYCRWQFQCVPQSSPHGEFEKKKKKMRGWDKHSDFWSDKLQDSCCYIWERKCHFRSGPVYAWEFSCVLIKVVVLWLTDIIITAAIFTLRLCWAVLLRHLYPSCRTNFTPPSSLSTSTVSRITTSRGITDVNSPVFANQGRAQALTT